jgi:hypothetical protein
MSRTLGPLHEASVRQLLVLNYRRHVDAVLVHFHRFPLGSWHTMTHEWVSTESPAWSAPTAQHVKPYSLQIGQEYNGRHE